jgi:hypothetical protein
MPEQIRDKMSDDDDEPIYRQNRILGSREASRPHRSSNNRNEMLQCPLLDLQCKEGVEGDSQIVSENSLDDSDQSNMSYVSSGQMLLIIFNVMAADKF